MGHLNVAIDGPAGAGKSTIAKEIAKRNGFIYVDTGAMYRAMALFCIRSGIDYRSEEKVNEIVDGVAIEIRYENGVQCVILNGENVNGLIRTEEVSQAASITSVYPKVRLKLVELQRQLAAENDVVMDGRDIASYVLPDANVKIFLTASVEERARRRCKELNEKGEACDIEAVKKDIEERDYRDSHREFAPLVQVPSATRLDTSDMTIEEVIAAIIKICEEAL